MMVSRCPSAECHPSKYHLAVGTRTITFTNSRLFLDMRPYRCTYCARSYKSRQSMKEHEYQCPYKSDPVQQGSSGKLIIISIVLYSALITSPSNSNQSVFLYGALSEMIKKSSLSLFCLKIMNMVSIGFHVHMSIKRTHNGLSVWHLTIQITRHHFRTLIQTPLKSPYRHHHNQMSACQTCHHHH